MAGKREHIVSSLSGARIIAGLTVVLLIPPGSCRALDGAVGATSTGSATIRVVVNRVLEPTFQARGQKKDICVWSNDPDTVFDVAIPQRNATVRRVAETRLANTFRSKDCAPLSPRALPNLKSDERVVLLIPAI